MIYLDLQDACSPIVLAQSGKMYMQTGPFYPMNAIDEFRMVLSFTKNRLYAVLSNCSDSLVIFC